MRLHAICHPCPAVVAWWGGRTGEQELGAGAVSARVAKGSGGTEGGARAGRGHGPSPLINRKSYN